jgi:hypothetical protein
MVYLWFLLFVLSFSGNIVLIWYARKLINQFKTAIETVASLNQIIDEYVIHLETVSEMETYYGDVTIENLLKHTKDVVKAIRDSGSLFSIADEPEETVNEES